MQLYIHSDRCICTHAFKKTDVNLVSCIFNDTHTHSHTHTRTHAGPTLSGYTTDHASKKCSSLCFQSKRVQHFNGPMGFYWYLYIFMLSEKLPVIHWLSNTAMGYPLIKWVPRVPGSDERRCKGTSKKAIWPVRAMNLGDRERAPERLTSWGEFNYPKQGCKHCKPTIFGICLGCPFFF